MPKIEVPKIYRELDLGEYAEELAGQTIPVWVNPPRSLLREFGEISAELQSFELNEDTIDEIEDINLKVFGWYAEIWTKHEQETAEGVRDMALQLQDTDPGLWSFLTQKTWSLISEHRRAERKN